MVLDILTIYQHLTTLWVINSEEKMQQRGLAKTRWSDNGIACTCFDLQIKVLEQVVYLTFCLFLLRFSIRNLITPSCCALVTEAHIFELYSSTIELELGSIG